MIRWIVEVSLQLRVLVVVAAVAIFGGGVAALRQMPFDVLPECSQPHVEIQTESLGLSAEEVEQLITVPMEQDLLSGLPWLSSIRSESLPGLSSVVLTFAVGADLMHARQMVSERLTQAVAMPHVSKPPTMLQPLSATNRVMVIGMSSTNVSPIQLSVLARWTVQPRLMGVPGVANVSIWGQRDRQLQVRVDPKRLQDNDITLMQVLETTGNALWVSSLSFVEASTPGTGGFIDTPNQRLGIRHVLPIVSAKQLAQVPVESSSKRLADVADVVEDHQPLIGDALTGRGPGVVLVVEKFPHANVLAVTRDIQDALAEMAPGLNGITFDQNIFRPAGYIEDALRNVGAALAAGLVLLAIVFYAYFLEWRATLVTLFMIALSLLASVGVLYAGGATLNAVTLVGLAAATGVVVYGATNIVARMRDLLVNPDHLLLEPRTARIADGVSEICKAYLHAAAIVFVAATPFLFLSDAIARLVSPFVIAFLVVNAVSLVTSLTICPALAWMLMPISSTNSTRRLISPVANWFSNRTKLRVGRDRRYTGWAWVLMGLLSTITTACLLLFDVQLLPFFREPQVLIHLHALPGTSQPEMSRIAERMSHELRGLAGVRDVGGHVGRAVMGDRLVNVNSAELWTSIDDQANYKDTVRAIKQVVAGYPGLNCRVQTYLQEKLARTFRQEKKNEVVVRVYGDRYEVLASTAGEIQNALQQMEGIANTRVKAPISEPTLEARVDIAAAKKRGLKPGDIRRAAATLLAGIPVGSLYQDQKVFDVVVWSRPQSRQSVTDVRELTIDAPDGSRVRLADVADIRVVPSASVIRHDRVKRYVDVVSEVTGRSLNDMAADIDRQLKTVKFPLEYYARVVTDRAVPHESSLRLLIWAVIAVSSALVLFQSAFGSWKMAMAATLALPSMAIGGLVAAIAVGGNALSLGSVAGLCAVFAFSVYCLVTAFVVCPTCREAQMITSAFSERMPERADLAARRDNPIANQQEGQPAGRGAIVPHDTHERLGTNLVAAIATGAFFTPALFWKHLPGLELIQPMAIVLLGGLISVALLMLIGLPESCDVGVTHELAT